jgi:hypothetical protein
MNVEHEAGSVRHAEGQAQLGHQAFVTTCPLFFYTNPSELRVCDER